LAITDKGKTAAEMMVFARYVMFSEVYWHHAVRSATAMLQRAIYLLKDDVDLERVLMPLPEQHMVEALHRLAKEKGSGDEVVLLDGIFGPKRQLYKRLAQYSYFEEPKIYRRLARRPYAELVGHSDQIAHALAGALGTSVAPHEVLVDAPPAELEVEFDVEVYFPKEKVYRSLGQISPMVRTLAREQFDDYVKRVRIFMHPRLAAEAQRLSNLGQRLAEAVEGR
jgi:HD superfamily phosphohydrolase